MPAAFEEPCNRRTVAGLQGSHPFGNLTDDSNAFMPQYNAGLIAEILILNVKVRMAHTAAFHVKKRFTIPQRAQFLFYNLCLFIFSSNYCFHMETPLLLGSRPHIVQLPVFGVFPFS